jgi:phosphoserine phosphatase
VLDKRIAAVFFDCDSTLTAVEGIDELARDAAPEVAREVERCTAAAMEGRMPLQEVYARRLQAIRPSRDGVARLGRRYVERMVEGARETVRGLRCRGVATGVVSGGLRPAVLVLTDALGIPPTSVHAVDVHFDAAGAYLGFDEEDPLARSGGKATVLSRPGVAPRPLCFVGDGVTDLETRAVVDVFVGYGGVTRRETVAREADVYLEDADLRRLLDLPFLR